MTLGAAASNPASKGPGGPQCLLPRSPRTRLTLRRVAWLAGIDAPCTALRATLRPLGPRPPRVCPRPPRVCPAAPAVPRMHAGAGRRAGHRNSRPGCDALPNAAWAPGPAADPKVRGKSAAAPPGPPAGPSPSLQTQNAIVLLCCGESHSARQRSREATKYVSPGTRAQVSVASSGPERICVAQVPLRASVSVDEATG